MKPAILFTIATVFALASTNASALGSKEEAILQFLGGVFVVEKIVDYSQRQQAPAPRSNYHSYHYYDPYYGSETERAYRQGQLERERREHRMAVDRAYQCGYYGNC